MKHEDISKEYSNPLKNILNTKLPHDKVILKVGQITTLLKEANRLSANFERERILKIIDRCSCYTCTDDGMDIDETHSSNYINSDELKKEISESKND